MGNLIRSEKLKVKSEKRFRKFLKFPKSVPLSIKRKKRAKSVLILCAFYVSLFTHKIGIVHAQNQVRHITMRLFHQKPKWGIEAKK
jgi:hypothetical protein